MNHFCYLCSGSRIRQTIAIGMVTLLALLAGSCRKEKEGSPALTGETTLTVYGFSIVKEPLEKEIFPAFQKSWLEKTGQQVIFASSFAGSEIVTNQILSGVKADVVILAIERDAERLQKGGATKTDWREFPHQGIVNETPFVIAVRKGNPKGIRDFEDLAKPGVKVIHPDPVSSGGAQWSLLAIYGAALMKSEKMSGTRDETKALALLKAIWKNVIATPGSAREARTQFETGFGDVLVTYELEALQLDDKREPFEIITPISTIFSQHPVVIVDRDISPGKRALVELFAHYLWSDAAQRAWVKYHFRSVTDQQLNKAEKRFAQIELPFRIDYFGGWSKAYPNIIEDIWKKQLQMAQQ